MHFFRIVSLFRLKTFYPISSTSQLNIGTHKQCSCFNLSIFQLDALSWKKGLAKFQFLLVFHSVFVKILRNFMATLFTRSFVICPCIFIYVFLQFDALSCIKGVSCKIPIFTDTCISFSFCQNFMKLYSYIIKSFTKFTCLFIYAKLLQEKGALCL